VGSRENGVAVGCGELGVTGVWRNGIEIGAPVHPERRRIMARIEINFFIIPLR